jgi:hypothetical protein
MAKKNFTISTVATAPDPAASGTSLVVASGDGSLFAENEPAVIFPDGEQPDSDNAEIVTITNISTDTLTITREQESTSARTVVVGDVIMQGITADDWNTLRGLITENADGFTISGGTTERDLILTGADITLTGSGTNTYTFPSATGTLVSRDSTDTLTNKTLRSPLFQGTWDGWIDANETWTYASADDPTYTFTISGDLSSKYSAGMRIKLTQTTAKYFIITKVAYSSPNTTITVYGGTDYDLANAAITSPYYSMVKAPQGFPLDPDKWSVETTDTSLRSQSSPAQNTWYNLGSVSINIPIGCWKVSYSVPLAIYDSSDAELEVHSTLSTGASSETNTPFTAITNTTNTSNDLASMVRMEDVLSLATKDTYYLLARTTKTGISAIYFLNNRTAETIITATCAYL